MTLNDMVCLAEAWIVLSEQCEGSLVERVILPGNLTGRNGDRVFQCIQMPTMPIRAEKETWGDYLYRAVDHIDFREILDAKDVGGRQEEARQSRASSSDLL